MVIFKSIRKGIKTGLFSIFCLLVLASNAQFESSKVHDWSIIGGSLATQVFTTIKKKKFNADKPFQGKGVPAFLWFDRGTIGNSSYVAGKTSDLFLYSSLGGLALGGVHTRQGTYLGLQTMAVTDLANLLAKNVVRRRRPFTYGNCTPSSDYPSCKKYDRRNYDASLSFYSGHTAQVAAFSYFTLSMLWFTTPSYQRGEGDWIYLLGGAIPAITGHLRIRAGKHFPSDVIVGYLAGAAAGYFIPKWHRDRDAEVSIGNLNDKMGLALLSGVGSSGLLFLLSKAVGKPQKACLSCEEIGMNASKEKVKFSIEPQLGISSGLRMALHF